MISPPISPPNSADTDRRALMALAAGAVAVGASPIFLLLGEIGPFAAAFHRAFLALPVLALWLVTASARHDGAKTAILPANGCDAALMALAGFFFAGDLAFWHLSLFRTAVANATLFANTAPVFVVLAGWLLFRRAPTRLFLLGLALALAGGVCLVRDNLVFAPENLLGDGYGIVTALFLAGYLMTVERLRRDYGTAAIMFWSTAATAACLLPLALAAGETLFAASLEGWLYLFALAWVAQAAGQGLIAYALAALPAALTAVGLLLEPVAAAFLAALILSQALSPWQGLGAAVILAGIACARLGARREAVRNTKTS
jgi:drug/metabolite transporter (DMT)-like permease